MIHENLSLENIEGEIWKDIPNYEGYYQCSNFGRVKSIDRMRANPVGSGFRKIKSIVLKQRFSTKKYLQIDLCKNSKSKVFRVHQLVAICFLEHNPCGMKLVVDHKDNNKLNNHVDNLQLLTNRLNLSKDKNFIGVSFHKPSKKWVSRIQINNQNLYLGIFKTQEEASIAYNNKLKTVD